jgi:hypothetical protein
VYWPISVAFEFAPEEANIDNLTDIEKKNPIEIIQAKSEVLRSRDWVLYNTCRVRNSFYGFYEKTDKMLLQKVRYQCYF